LDSSSSHYRIEIEDDMADFYDAQLKLLEEKTNRIKKIIINERGLLEEKTNMTKKLIISVAQHVMSPVLGCHLFGLSASRLQQRDGMRPN
jgi:hypothetical protein